MTQQGIGIPAYWYPSGGKWGRAVQAHHVVLGTDGSSKDSTKVAAVKDAHNHGCSVLGYVSTGYGKTSLATCLQHVQNYIDWYGTDGIMFDTMSSSASFVAQYQSLVNQTRAKFAAGTRPVPEIWGNPGTYPDAGYANVMDVIECFEGSYAQAKNVRVPAWARALPDHKFKYTFHDTSAKDMPAALNLARANNAKYVYCTDGTEASGNPYSSVPTYWDDEVVKATNDH